jgi:aryl-alcohol dehydrogenase
MNVDQCGRCEGCLEETPYCVDGFRIAMGYGRKSPLRRDNTIVHGNFFSQSSFATHALTPERTLVKVQKDIPLDILGPFACSGVTGAGGVLTGLVCRPNSSIAIFGAGGVGLCAVIAAQIAGCKTIIAVDMKPQRLALAAELGATHIVNAIEIDPVEEILSITEGGVNYSLECAGSSRAIKQSVEALRDRGLCGLTGQVRPGEEVSLNPYTFLAGRTLRGLVRGEVPPKRLIPKLLEFYKQGRFPIERIIRYYSLDQINEAVEDMACDRTVKAVLLPNGAEPSAA